MGARFLIRFDDVCETMNWFVWEQVEAILKEHDIRPILAVVPDNRDKHLQVSNAHPYFWDRVREWSARGYAIGLHGYQHLFTTKDAGILRFRARSEFAGLSCEEQGKKIAAGLDIFHSQKVHPDCFVAPAHSFDTNTLRALMALGIRTVSDGYFPFPRQDRSGVRWLPQQLWHFRPMPFGVWTICLHINSWTDTEVARFARDVDDFIPWISDPKRVLAELDYAPRTWTSVILPEQLFAPLYRAAIGVKRRLTVSSGAQKAPAERAKNSPLFIRILVRKLNCGGAERQIVELTKHLLSRGISVEVLTFYDGGVFADELERMAPGVHRSLHKASRWDLTFLFRLYSELRSRPSTILSTFFESGNVLGGLFCPRKTTLIWNIRCSTLEDRGILHRLLQRIEDVLGKRPRRIVCNSMAGERVSKDRGFPSDRLVVIPNGVDTEHFRIDRSAGGRFREAHSISEESIVVLLPARLDPVKNHRLFIDAAAVAAEQEPRLFFVCVGGGNQFYLEQLKSHVSRLGLVNQIRFLGAVSEMCAAYNAADLVTITSRSEGFPNILVEALACGVPCVAVDVGDCRNIIANDGETTPQDPILLSAAWLRVARRGRESYAEAARARCLSTYSLESLGERFLAEAGSAEELRR